MVWSLITFKNIANNCNTSIKNRRRSHSFSNRSRSSCRNKKRYPTKKYKKWIWLSKSSLLNSRTKARIYISWMWIKSTWRTKNTRMRTRLAICRLNRRTWRTNCVSSREQSRNYARPISHCMKTTSTKIISCLKWNRQLAVLSKRSKKARRKVVTSGFNWCTSTRRRLRTLSFRMRGRWKSRSTWSRRFKVCRWDSPIYRVRTKSWTRSGFS